MTLEEWKRKDRSLRTKITLLTNRMKRQGIYNAEQAQEWFTRIMSLEIERALHLDEKPCK